MEIFSNSTRFALACNTSSKIIEPIQSRCALVRFSRLSDQEILGRLMVVVEAEKVQLVSLSNNVQVLHNQHYCHFISNNVQVLHNQHYSHFVPVQNARRY
jgi:replication factor C subunit 2/4